MDRLETPIYDVTMRVIFNNLYSSMDRLETPIYDVTMRVIFNNLYSSMDRLETYNEMRIRNDIV